MNGYRNEERETTLGTIDNPISLKKDASLGGEKRLARAMSELRHEFELSLDCTFDGNANLHSLELMNRSMSVMTAQSTFDGIDDNYLGKDASSIDRVMASLRYPFRDDTNLHSLENKDTFDRSTSTMTSKSTFDFMSEESFSKHTSIIDSAMDDLHYQFADDERSSISLLEQRSNEHRDKSTKLDTSFSNSSKDSGFLGMVQHTLRALNETNNRNSAKEGVERVENVSPIGLARESVGNAETLSVRDSQKSIITTDLAQEQSQHKTRSEPGKDTTEPKINSMNESISKKDTEEIEIQTSRSKSSTKQMKVEGGDENNLAGALSSLMGQCKTKEGGVIYETVETNIALQCESIDQKRTENPTSTMKDDDNDILCKKVQITFDVEDNNEDDKSSTLLCGCRVGLSSDADIETDRTDSVDCGSVD